MSTPPTQGNNSRSFLIPDRNSSLQTIHSSSYSPNVTSQLITLNRGESDYFNNLGKMRNEAIKITVEKPSLVKKTKNLWKPPIKFIITSRYLNTFSGDPKSLISIVRDQNGSRLLFTLQSTEYVNRNDNTKIIPIDFKYTQQAPIPSDHLYALDDPRKFQVKLTKSPGDDNSDNQLEVSIPRKKQSK